MSRFLCSWGMNRSAKQTNRPRTASSFTRFVCPALRFIPHEPRKRDTHSSISPDIKRGSRGGPGSVTPPPPPPRDLSEVGSCGGLIGRRVGAGVQLLLLPYYYHFFWLASFQYYTNILNILQSSMFRMERSSFLCPRIE